MSDIPKIFGSMVFGDSEMKSRLSSEVYSSLKKTIESGSDLDKSLADDVARAMKEWAVERGATHYTHWFQPMTGITAEKHDSFISRDREGKVIMGFSGKQLIKGEPDASSFPSGGLRATFEARGYTAWDPTSYAFVKDETLCIPTVFCSYGGEILDMKTPLLRSCDVLSAQALRILRLFGDNETDYVNTTVGAEQEYFLIDKALFDKRDDLIFCGRTLFGAKPPKGQEMDDHYFGAIKPRVKAFMRELDEELWRLGITAKTEHNESAPAQHELAPIFASANMATDHNQLTMEFMKKVALRHGLVCLLHEKPFAGVNGSGKHNNWSLSTPKGENLLDGGAKPYENKRFLLFLCAVIAAVDNYQDLLRVSVATAGNDHRLGAAEAPPAIVSIFLGDELSGILDAIKNGKPYGEHKADKMSSGIAAVPDFSKDTTDRNRTSPFAFTGNKFEFRMLGSAISIACPNIILNTIVADTLREFADTLEGAPDFDAALDTLLRECVARHERIIFNGDGYSAAWQEEAARRGLYNLPTTVDALPHFISPKNVALFERNRIYTEAEMHSRYEVLLDKYRKTVHIEALTMLELAKRKMAPAISKYTRELADTVIAKRQLLPNMPCAEAELMARLSALGKDLADNICELESAINAASTTQGSLECAVLYKERVIPAMQATRRTADAAEADMPHDIWPFPTYSDLLFKI